jgi:hypothetical protein
MNKLVNLRSQHNKIAFQSYTHSISGSVLNIEFKYILSPDLNFSHKLSIDFCDLKFKEPSPKLVFLLGVMELISYWKLTCPSVIEIKCGVLNDYEKEWFKDVYLSGLGEFFFVNQLYPKLEFDFVIDPEAPELEVGVHSNLEDKSLVMVGGGKDSLVSLRAFKELGRDFRGFVVNPIPQAIDSIKLFSERQPISVKREICSRFINLPKDNYFNGHIPFSAVLAFIGLVVGDASGFRNVVTSNESTANEGNVVYHGMEINHQYSKTFDFEARFRELVRSLGSELNYYSFLRPLSELQITALLSRDSSSLETFLSCNRAQTFKAKESGEHKWCGTCPKCIFTFLSLAPFLNPEELSRIWSPLPNNYEGFNDIVRDLCGLGEHKPLECVGSYAESRTGFYYLSKKIKIDSAEEIISSFGSDFELSDLNYWDGSNYLNDYEASYLKESLKEISYKE